jgi:hypothetical protein
MPEQIDQCRKTLFAVGIDIEAGIVQEAGAAPHPDAAVVHVA